MAEKKYHIQMEIEGIDELDGLIERQSKLAAELEGVACQIRFALHGINAKLTESSTERENYISARSFAAKVKELTDPAEEEPVILKRKVLRAEDTVELKEVRHCDEANLLLDKGWSLRAVSVGCYIMSRPRDAEK